MTEAFDADQEPEERLGTRRRTGNTIAARTLDPCQLRNWISNPFLTAMLRTFLKLYGVYAATEMSTTQGRSIGTAESIQASPFDENNDAPVTILRERKLLESVVHNL